MKTTLNIVGAILVLIGAIWFLQGINILPGSFMTGQTRWAVYGGIAVAAGIVLLVIASRRRHGGRYSLVVRQVPLDWNRYPVVIQ
jgi:hypothetical protein